MLRSLNFEGRRVGWLEKSINAHSRHQHISLTTFHFIGKTGYLPLSAHEVVVIQRNDTQVADFGGVPVFDEPSL